MLTANKSGDYDFFWITVVDLIDSPSYYISMFENVFLCVFIGLEGIGFLDYCIEVHLSRCLLLGSSQSVRRTAK